MVAVSFATLFDLDILASEDHVLQKEDVQQKIERNEYIIAKKGDQYLGFLRFSYFWSIIPMIDLIIVEEAYRGLVENY